MPRFGFFHVVRAAALVAGCYLLASCGQPDPQGGCADDCLTPPLPVCNGATLVSFSFLGECVDGTCQYPPVETTCGFGCEDGACQTAPLCDTDCSDRASECDGETAVRFESAGCDSEGACLYDEEREDCAAAGRVCDQGACIVAPGPCDGVDCSVPPAPFCAGETAVVFAAVECVDGECPWVEQRADCARVGRACIDGECVSRCDGVECNAAPPGYCEGVVAVNYAPEGNCIGTDGSCEYDAASRVPCDQNLGGRCLSGQCIEGRACSEGCEEPPPSFCNTNIAVRFNAGACVDGLCSFSEVVEDCGALGQRCFDGFCSVEPPCEGVTCDEPPVAFCDGNTVVSYEEFGACLGGDCTYQTLRTDCGEVDGACVGGVCRTDLCDGVTCPDPAPPFCSGNVVVAAQPGACAATGVCNYATSRTDCSLSGSTCVDGACVDACIGVSCGEAPAAYCSGTVAVRPTGEGTCFRGNCNYTEERENCRASGLFCEAGACVPDSPCRGVTCDFPPADYCAGTVRNTYASSGECADGTCGYDPETYDCALSEQACSLGRCVDACLGDPCDRAPAPICEDTDTLRVSNPTGTCIAERCQYATALLECETPPAGFCEGQLAVTFDADGSCSTGACRYPRVYTDCPATPGGQCLDGACVTVDPCDDVTCNTPPPSRCEGNLELSYVSDGTCRLGTCTYELQVDDCAAKAGGTCQDGACVDPCEGVECPATGVCFGDVSRQADEPGTCVAGTCEYDWTRDVPCNAIAGGTCEDGYCVDPCEGNACDAPPAPTCSGNTVNTWQTPGTCEAGTCNYIAVNVSCDILRGGTCVDGACVTECDDGCEAPPPATCEGNLAFQYAAAGGCDSGQCNYPLTVLDCAATPGGTCVAGACVDPCDGVVCNTPPADACIGTLGLDYDAVGTCFAGTCSYELTRNDCGSVIGGTCSNGVCSDPCSGVVCNTPPATVCDGDLLEGWQSTGLCEGGTCRYTRANTACDVLLGGSCVGGACVTECDGGCSTPPPGVCDGDIARRRTAAGSCVSGQCSYAEVFEDCAAVAGGECIGNGVCVNPCADVTCDAPAPRCDGVFVVSVGEAGACERGVCRYEEDYFDCSAVPGGTCIAGACFDPCAAELCDDPPLGMCDGPLFYGYEEPGECYAGVCDYLAVTPVDCEDRYNGLCAPTGCITECDLGCPDVPEPLCDGDIRTEFVATGCEDGRCLFTPQQQNCQSLGSNFRCVSGECVDLCDGVVCPDPDPAPTCGDGTYTYIGAGVCSAGTCNYSRVAETCPGPSGDLCNGGRCVQDPRCDGVVCDSPPAPTCTGELGSGRIVYVNGECVAGACSYVETFESCIESGRFCLDGVCGPVPPTCTGVECPPPPPSSCQGDLLTTYNAGSGTCTLSEGRPTCDYAALEVTTNCRTTGEFCIDGDCVAGSAPGPGDIVITEIMVKPNIVATEGQWVELYNRSAVIVDLSGMSLRNPDNVAQTLSLSGRILPGGYFVVGRELYAPAYDEFPDFTWTGTWTLPVAAGAVELVRGSTVFDSVRWSSGWPLRDGLAMAVVGEPDAATNDTASAWCSAPELYDVGGRGTPGQRNLNCVLNAVTDAVAGEITIVEYMASPTVGGDWFEVSVQSPFYLDLNGLVVEAGGVVGTIGSLIAAPGESIAIGANAEAAAGFVDVIIPGMALGPVSGSIALRGATEVIASLVYSNPLYSSVSGRSTQIDDRFRATPDVPDVWCFATGRYDAANSGTPSDPNENCPGVRGHCLVNADCSPIAYCDEGYLVQRTTTATCDTFRRVCLDVGAAVTYTDCGASGLACYNRTCTDD